MGYVMALFGGLIAYALFGSNSAKRRVEHSGLESGMILLGMIAFGVLFVILF